MKDTRRGAALVTVVLIALALFALGHGMLTLSLGELAASHSAARYVGARAGADAARARLLTESEVAWLDSVAVGAERAFAPETLGRTESVGLVRRLTRESWWVEGVGRHGVAEARIASLAWALDPLERVLDLEAIVTIGAGAPVEVRGALDASAPTMLDPPLTAADCAPWSTALEVRHSSDPFAALGLLPVADSLPHLGLLDFSALLGDASVTVSGVGTPAPFESFGACVRSEPWNWGDPARPWGACGDFLPLRGSRGPIEMSAGAGQGVLVVDGDVVLSGGARFHGLVVASGALRLEDDAAFEGMALAAGGVYVASGAAVRGSACAAARALAAQRGTLGSLRVVPGVGSLGPL
jgi:hypothetical protein